MNRYLPMLGGKFLCRVCLAELSKRKARFHALHCRIAKGDQCSVTVTIDGVPRKDD
jgi:hypothetical protein